MNQSTPRPLLALVAATGLAAGAAAATIVPAAAPAAPGLGAALLDGDGGGPGDPPNGPPCADVDGSGIVDLDDLLIVLQSFETGDLAGDVNMSGGIEFADIVLTLVQWGGSCD